jgi:hypothetical protein
MFPVSSHFKGKFIDCLLYKDWHHVESKLEKWWGEINEQAVWTQCVTIIVLCRNFIIHFWQME